MPNTLQEFNPDRVDADSAQAISQSSEQLLVDTKDNTMLGVFTILGFSAAAMYGAMVNFKKKSKEDK